MPPDDSEKMASELGGGAAPVAFADAGARTARLADAGAEVKARRGRPPGSRNRVTGTPEKDANVERFGGAVLVFFALIGFILGRFGYEKTSDLTTKEAEQGALHLIPIADKLGWLVTLTVWLGFPFWMLTKIGEHFTKRKAVKEAPPTQTQGVAPPLSGAESGAAPDSPGGDPAFTSTPLRDVSSGMPGA
jgi:hypothetical protein